MPSRIRIADDGTIIRENVASVAPTEPRSPSVPDTPIFSVRGRNDVDMSGAIAIPRPWWQKPGSHWTITMFISAIISLISFLYIAPLVFTTTGSSGFMESIINFFMIISPYVILASGIIGQILYNKKFANKYDRGYTVKDYALSPLVSSGSVVAAGVGMTLLTLAAAIIVGLLVVVLVVAILIGIFSGS